MALLADRGRLAAVGELARKRAGFWTEQAHGRVLLADHLRPLHEECARSKAELAEIEKEEAKGDACAYLEGAPPYDPSPPPPPTTEEELAAEDEAPRRARAPPAARIRACRASRSTRPRRRAGGRGKGEVRHVRAARDAASRLPLEVGILGSHDDGPRAFARPRRRLRSSPQPRHLQGEGAWRCRNDVKRSRWFVAATKPRTARSIRRGNTSAAFTRRERANLPQASTSRRLDGVGGAGPSLAY